MNHLESLTKKIITVCPDIVEKLVPGSIARKTNLGTATVLYYDKDKNRIGLKWHGTGDIIHRELDPSAYHEIIGRQINLEDVMRAIEESCRSGTNTFAIFCDGKIGKVNSREILSEWILGKPLDQQPLETIEFLDNLLPENESQ